MVFLLHITSPHPRIQACLRSRTPCTSTASYYSAKIPSLRSFHQQDLWSICMWSFGGEGGGCSCLGVAGGGDNSWDHDQLGHMLRLHNDCLLVVCPGGRDGESQVLFNLLVCKSTQKLLPTIPPQYLQISIPCLLALFASNPPPPPPSMRKSTKSSTLQST